MHGLTALLLGYALFGNPSADRLPSQGYCPAETTRARELAIRYATGQDGGVATRNPNVPIVTANDVHLMVDSNPFHRIPCAVLLAQMESLRGSQHSAAEWTLTFYSVAGRYYAIAIPTTPPVVPSGTGTLMISLRAVPLYVFDSNFRVITGVGM